MTVQQKLCNNKWFRLGVSVVLTLAVVLVFVCAPWSCAHAIVGVDDAVIVILIAALAGCGITFASTGAFNTLEEYVGNLFQEYATDNNTTVYSLTNGLQSNANKLGQILLNNRWLVMIQGFADWLVLKYSLANNNDYVLEEYGEFVGNKVAYSLPLVLQTKKQGSSGGDRMEFAVITATAPTVCVLSYKTSGTRQAVYPIFISANIATVNYTYYNGLGVNTGSYDIYLAQNNSTLYYGEPGQGHWYIGTGVGEIDLSDYTYYTYNSVISSIRNNSDVTSNDVGIDIHVGNLNLPLDNPDYVAGDGGILDVGADWTTPYPSIVDGIPIEWPDVVTDDTTITLAPVAEADLTDQLPAPTDIENLPGGSTFALPDGFGNLRLSDIWHYVHQWVVDTAVAGGLLWNTATVMASPVVNMAYAMVVIAIVFGVMKQLRSH